MNNFHPGCMKNPTSPQTSPSLLVNVYARDRYPLFGANGRSFTTSEETALKMKSLMGSWHRKREKAFKI